MKKIIATDLDRTLLPNGEEEYDNSLPLFNKIINDKKIPLVYVTGRNLKLVKKALKRFKIPFPNYLISNVGTRIYFSKGNKFKCDKKWFKEIKEETPEWNIKKMRSFLKSVNGLKLQEKENQDKFKLSYYVELSKEKEVLKKVRDILRNLKNIGIIYSVDYPKPRGLLDILPACANKKGALDYVIEKMNKNNSEDKKQMDKKNVIFCGDSGNDLPLLTSKYKSILVRNSKKDVKEEAKKQNKNKKDLYIASSGKYIKHLNGNYVSGILQGLIYFNVIDKKDVSLK